MKWSLCALALLLAGCQSSPSEVTNKVLSDFGLRERPEGYVTMTDRIEQELETVGQVELDRLNREARQGEVKFQEDDTRGMYYREVKRYERARPLDAVATPSNSQQDRQFQGYVEYTYRIYQSGRKLNRMEAAAAPAEIAMPETGREVLRYRFDAGGRWNGEPGEPARR